jgi:Mn2+/Fe2+ NRAMP family transporter
LQVLHHAYAPNIPITGDYLLLSVALVGTTIAPWQLFYLQASVVDKGLREQELQYERADVFIGSLITDVVAFFIIVATAATLFVHDHHHIADAKDAAQALVPFAGASAKLLFVIGLLGASLLACAVIPLSTSYALTEALGWERGVGRSIRQAPAFFIIFTGLIVVCSAMILVPGLPLTTVTLVTQDVDGIILPAILVFMFILVNDRRLLGRYANGVIGNVVGGATLLAVIMLVLALVLSGLPGFPWAHF